MDQQDHLDNKNDTLWPENVDPSYHIPSQIDVAVYKGPEYYEFPVEIVVEYSSKPYIGGYRNKNNGKHYHNAITQTDDSFTFEMYKHRVYRDTSKQITRETQTQELRNHSVQCRREFGTQMERVDLKLDDAHDKILAAREYLSSNELAYIKKMKAIKIQGFVRVCLAKMVAKRIRKYNREMAEAAEEARRREEERLRAIEEYERLRRINPKTRDDFNILHQELDIMHKRDIERIKADLKDDDNAKTVALRELLDRESDRIAEIDRIRTLAQRDFKSEWVRKDLEKMATPLTWSLSGKLKGDLCVVETPQSTRATELLRLYSALEAPVTSTPDRLDVLSQVKDVVVGEDSRLLRDIYELVAREMDLLNRGRSSNMTQLRLRLQHLLVSYIQNPVYNPAAGLPDRRLKLGQIP